MVIYIARFSAKSDYPLHFPVCFQLPPERVALSTPPCGILRSVFCDVDPPTLILIHLLLINFLRNSIIRLCISRFSSCSNVLNRLYVKRRLQLFSPFFKYSKDFCCNFWYCIYRSFIFEVKLSVIYIFLLLQIPNQSLVCPPFKYFAEYISKFLFWSLFIW